MSVWRNEQDFMSNVDNMLLSEFYIKDKKPSTSPKKLNIQKPVQVRSWYESDSEDEFPCKGKTEDCPSMEPIDTLQMMESIRMQVRNVVGDRYNNDVLEKLYKMDQECDESSSSVPEVASSFLQVQVSDNKVKSVNGDVEEPIASTSILKKSKNNVKHKSQMRGKTYNNNNRGRGCAPRYHNNVAFTSLEPKKPYNYVSTNEFPPL